MPTPPAVPQVCRWRILGTLANLAPWGVRFYTLYSGSAPSSANMLAFAEAIASAWNTNCGHYQNENVKTTQVDGIDLSSSLGAGATADVDYSGGQDTSPVDNQIAAVVKFDIARRYRGGKPKMYIPGIDAEYVADGSHWTDTLANDLGTAMEDFDNAVSALVEGATSLFGIVNVSLYEGFTSVESGTTHRYRNVPNYRATPLIDIVTSFTCDTLMGSQRRRRVG